MTANVAIQETEVYKPQNNIRIVTATALFDGHDATINIMRRILMDTGIEVIHLAHNRSVNDVVDAAIEEDAQGIAVSSYQGGHVEYFKYMVDLLKERNAPHIKVFCGGGGVFVPAEIKELESYGVTKIYSPEDGAEMGLQGMINHMTELLDFPVSGVRDLDSEDLDLTDHAAIARMMTIFEQMADSGIGMASDLRNKLNTINSEKQIPIIGITGTCGAGKSSLTDELIFRFLHDFKELKLAVISCDPSRRKSGGALLGDRIRMNSIASPRVYMRSLATRKSHSEIPISLADAILVAKAAGFDVVIVETAGIGQGDSRIIDLVDIPIYVMTSDFGAATQLEKIDMLDYADLVVINKYEKHGSEDALLAVRKQMQRNMKAYGVDPKEMPVYGTIASKFADDGVTAFYHGVLDKIKEKKG